MRQERRMGAQWNREEPFGFFNVHELVSEHGRRRLGERLERRLLSEGAASGASTSLLHFRPAG